jgi:hypothetical protein
MKPRTIAPPEQYFRSKTVSRADLVYWLLQTGEDLDSLADLLWASYLLIMNLFV